MLKRINEVLRGRRGYSLSLVLMVFAIATALGVTLLTAANAVNASSAQKVAHAQEKEYGYSCLMAVDRMIQDGKFDAAITGSIAASVAAGGTPGAESYTAQCSTVNVPEGAVTKELSVQAVFKYKTATAAGDGKVSGSVIVNITVTYGESRCRYNAEYGVVPSLEDPAAYKWTLTSMGKGEAH